MFYIIQYFSSSSAVNLNLKPHWMAAINSKYMQLRVLNTIYSESLNQVLCVMLGSTIARIIAITFVLLNPVGVPLVLLGAFALGDAVILIQARFFLGITTNSFILTLNLVQKLGNCIGRKFLYQKQFWKGMRPIAVPIGHFFLILSQKICNCIFHHT